MHIKVGMQQIALPIALHSRAGSRACSHGEAKREDYCMRVRAADRRCGDSQSMAFERAEQNDADRQVEQMGEPAWAFAFKVAPLPSAKRCTVAKHPAREP
jgi:hypothetical protein